MSFNLKGIGDFFTGNKWDLDGLGDGTSTFDPNYSDFYDQGGWTETIIGPDMSEEIYRGTVGDDRWSLDFLKDYIGSSDREPTNLDTAKREYDLPTDRSRGYWYEQISPKVGIYGGSPTGGVLGGSLPALASTASGAFRPAGGGALGIQNIAQLGSNFAQSKLTDMALTTAAQAIPGLGPALVIANKVYPGGLPGAFKDVTRFAGDVGNTIASGIGGVVRGIGSLFCDERLKVDIAPLERTEVNDELAQMAFFVKGIRECS